MGALKDFIVISSAGVKDTYITGRFQRASDGSQFKSLQKPQEDLTSFIILVQVDLAKCILVALRMGHLLL
jgi:hypothetical protein